jgi:hypothetical protein
MPAAVSLSKLVSALQFAGPKSVVQVDRQSGEVVEGPLGAATPASSALFQPITVEIDELECAKRFCETVADLNDRRRLATALAGARPMESFEHAIFRVGVAHDWFPFRDRQVANAAQACLEAQGIPFVDDLG